MMIKEQNEYVKYTEMIEKTIFSKNYFNILKKIIFTVETFFQYEIIKLIDNLFEILKRLTDNKVISIQY